MGLVKPDGFVGLLTPSGIYADKTRLPLFKTVSTSGRVGGLFDFENRRLGTDLPPFFPDIDSRFKFCALIFGGAKRTFDETKCAFFLHDTATIDRADRCFPLSPDDFARVTQHRYGTDLRSQRDAEVALDVYKRHRVLVDRTLGSVRKTWPCEIRARPVQHDVRFAPLPYRGTLDAEGFYEVQGNRWKRGNQTYAPLYEGKMTQAFDHRAASVIVNPKNIHRPAQPRVATPDEHADPDWLPFHSSGWTPTHSSGPIT